MTKIIHLASRTGGGDQHVEIATEKRGLRRILLRDFHVEQIAIRSERSKPKTEPTGQQLW